MIGMIGYMLDGSDDSNRCDRFELFCFCKFVDLKLLSIFFTIITSIFIFTGLCTSSPLPTKAMLFIYFLVNCCSCPSSLCCTCADS